MHSIKCTSSNGKFIPPLYTPRCSDKYRNQFPSHPQIMYVREESTHILSHFEGRCKLTDANCSSRQSSRCAKAMPGGRVSVRADRSPLSQTVPFSLSPHLLHVRTTPLVPLQPFLTTSRPRRRALAVPSWQRNHLWPI